jgi:hypothetical protein
MVEAGAAAASGGGAGGRRQGQGRRRTLGMGDELPLGVWVLMGVVCAVEVLEALPGLARVVSGLGCSVHRTGIHGTLR